MKAVTNKLSSVLKEMSIKVSIDVARANDVSSHSILLYFPTSLPYKHTQGKIDHTALFAVANWPSLFNGPNQHKLL